MVKFIVLESPKWASKLNISVRILGHAKYLISGNLILVPKFKLSRIPEMEIFRTNFIPPENNS